MQAKTFTIIGLRLLAALSFIRTINSISLWTAEQHGNTAITVTGSGLLLASIPIILGIVLWIAAPKLAALFSTESDANVTETSSLPKKEDFLTIGLVAIGILILMNAIPAIILTSAEWLLTSNQAHIDWLLIAGPAIKIALCILLISKAKKLSGFFLTA